MINQIFTEARTYRHFLDKPVTDDQIRQIYDMARLAPTSSNTCPMRVSFVRSEADKEKVIAAASEGNRDKIRSAPVVAIIAHDVDFHQHVMRLAPFMGEGAFKDVTEENRATMANENTWLQAGFLIAAARSIGLDCGPIGGFNKDKIDQAFHQDSKWKASFLINIGYGNPETLHPRGERLGFDEACRIL